MKNATTSPARTGAGHSESTHPRTCLASGGCSSKVVEQIPVALCAEHAIQVYSHMQSLVDSAPMLAKRKAAARSNTGKSSRKADLPEVVYYVELHGSIKIGYSSNYLSRMTDYPPDAKLLAVELGGRSLETERLREFQEYRVARREWHSKGSRLMEHIATLPRSAV